MAVQKRMRRMATTRVLLTTTPRTKYKIASSQVSQDTKHVNEMDMILTMYKSFSRCNLRHVPVLGGSKNDKFSVPYVFVVWRVPVPRQTTLGTILRARVRFGSHPTDEI